MGREYTDGNHSKSSVGIGNLESLLKVRVPQEPLVFFFLGRRPSAASGVPYLRILRAPSFRL